jgi:hypothetical protein
MSFRSSLPVRQVVGFLFGIGLLVALLWYSGLLNIPAATRPVPPWLWALVPLLLLISHGFRGARIYAELSAHGAVAPGACLRIGLLHSAAVNIVPLRGGELAYPWLVHRHTGMGRMHALASLLRMRGQDLVVLALLGLLLLPPWPLTSRLLAMAMLAALVTLSLLRLRRAGRHAATAAGDSRLRQVVRALAAGGRHAALGWVCCSASWLVKLAAVGALLASAAGLPADAALRGGLAGELSALWPLQAPAGLGTYEAGVFLGAVWPPGGATAPAVLAAALMAHAVIWITTVGAAAVAWFGWGVLPAPGRLAFVPGRDQ